MELRGFPRFIMSSIVTKRVTEYVPRNKWIASLSNGETIFEDNIPGEISSWNRLRDYVKENNLSITRLRLQLGALEVTVPPSKQGYLQKKKMISTGGYSKLLRGIGYVEDGKALIHYIGEDRSSATEIEDDPGEPWVIYNVGQQNV